MQHPTCKNLLFKIFAASPLEVFATSPCKICVASTLPKQFPFNMFALFTLQNVCSIHPAKEIQSFKMIVDTHKMFAASSLQNICSILSAKYSQHQACKMYAAFTLQKNPKSKWLQRMAAMRLQEPKSHKFLDPKR